MEEGVVVHEGEVGCMKQKKLSTGEYDMNSEEFVGPMHGPHRSFTFILEGGESYRKLKTDLIPFQLEYELCTAHKRRASQ